MTFGDAAEAPPPRRADGGMSLAESARMVELIDSMKRRYAILLRGARHGCRVPVGRSHLGAGLRSRDRLRRSGSIRNNAEVRSAYLGDQELVS
jgi:hypothetical protein